MVVCLQLMRSRGRPHVEKDVTGGCMSGDAGGALAPELEQAQLATTSNGLGAVTHV